MLSTLVVLDKVNLRLTPALRMRAELSSLVFGIPRVYDISSRQYTYSPSLLQDNIIILEIYREQGCSRLSIVGVVWAVILESFSSSGKFSPGLR